MSIKAIVLDVDGTLLTSEKKISLKTKEKLIAVQEKGIRIILASGRPTNGMFYLADELNMQDYGGYLISYNGGAVHECRTGKQLLNQTMAVEKCREILEHLKKFDVIPMINDNEYMYVNDVYKQTLYLENGEEKDIIEYESRGGNFKLCEQDDLAEFLEFPLNKILIAGQPSYLKEHYQEIYSPFTESVTAAFSAPFYYEFTDLGIDKAKALKIVCEQLSITSDALIAFGDGQNDRSIIEFAGTGVAMGNAVEEIKEIAKTVTLSNNKDGIAIALDRLLS